MSQPSGTEYTLDIASSSIFCRTPHICDPYESFFVEVKPSKIIDAGQGLFAKIDIDVGTVICFYNGVRVKSTNDLGEPSPYKMILDETTDIDIPENMTDLENYSATLGHKVCHSFKPNADSEIFCHPRFGIIRCIVSIEIIAAKEEIFINYGYSMPEAPTWYKLAWAKHQKTVRKIPDWKIGLKSSSQNIVT